MDPIEKLFMFESWLADQMDNAELAKNHAYLLGSFWNPEAVKKMIGEGAGTHVSSEEEFEATTQMIRKTEEATIRKPRKRRKLKV